jgi:hypothetical protein
MLAKKFCVAPQSKYLVFDTLTAPRLDFFRNHSAGLVSEILGSPQL